MLSRWNQDSPGIRSVRKKKVKKFQKEEKSRHTPVKGITGSQDKDTVCSRNLEEETSRARIISGDKGLGASHNTTQR